MLNLKKPLHKFISDENDLSEFEKQYVATGIMTYGLKYTAKEDCAVVGSIFPKETIDIVKLDKEPYHLIVKETWIFVNFILQKGDTIILNNENHLINKKAFLYIY